ncbi:MAG: tyrosine--tRNA ligase [Deltaproteobacteria bacterium]|nr:MAG: tyrosine--tRNA ligase [Deltaproteobacteria bacterium]
MLSVEAQLETLCRGVVDLHVRRELEERLATGTPLIVKAGFDPTRPDLHLGHTVLLEKLRQFQMLGHRVVFLIGDFTAMVGDPTGQNEARPRLTRQDVKAAAETYQTQAFKVLDQDKTEVRYNSEWLEKLDFYGMIELGAQYTVARMLERADFAKRYAEQRPIHIHEFMYPLLQGYDSVALESDIELGGTDQLFNLLVGRDIMPRYGKKPQLVMTTPLLEGIDARLVDGKVVGPKMSKSANNYVAIDEPAFDMLQKLMLVDDQVVWRYMELLSPRTTTELTELRASVDAGTTDIIAAKEQFARDTCERFRGKEDTEAAFARRRRISAGGVPDDVAEIEVAATDQRLGLAKALQLASMTKSTSEAMRLLKQGGVYLEGERVTDPKLTLEKGKRYLVRIGSKKRRFAYLVVS